jgi:hypothetical protein
MIKVEEENMREKTYESKKIPWSNIGLIVALVGILVTLVSIIVTIRDMRSRVVTVQTGIERVGEQILAKEFRITFPSDGDSVGLNSLIRGETPYLDMNHYIMVTPVKTGTDFIEGEPVKIYSGGSWTGTAKFGEAGAGGGENFIVRAIATASALAPGALAEVPKGAKFSESITVTRKK